MYNGAVFRGQKKEFLLRTAVEASTNRALPAASSHEVKHRVIPNVWGFAAAAVLAAFYFATSLYIASHRLFWVDEIVTMDVARLPNAATIWQALAHGVDAQPPLYYILVRMFVRIFGPSEVAARLPSILAMVAGLLITFDCARRLTDGLHGLLALGVLTCSFLPPYGYEARPYAIYLMLASLSFWIWACTGYNKRWSAILFGTVLFLSVTIHYHAVLLLVPYGLWELYYWKPWRPPSAKLLAGLLGVLVSLALFSKLMMAAFHSFAAHATWAAPSVGRLRLTLLDFFPDGLFLLPFIIIWVVLTSSMRPNRTGVVVQPMQASEAVGWLFLCIPLAGFVLAELKTSILVSRYFISLLAGVAVAVACLLWRNFRSSRRISFGIFLLLAGWGSATQLWTALHSREDPRTVRIERFLSLEDPLRSEGKRFLVVSILPGNIEPLYYSKHPNEWIFLLPSVPTSASITELNLGQYYPRQFWEFSDLRKQASEVALIDPDPELLDELGRAGLKLTIRLSKPVKVVYIQ